MEVEKQIREIIEFYCGGTYENRNTATKEILQICQALQLQQTGVIVQSEQLKTCEHNFADVYDHTSTQIVGKKCLNGCGF